MAHPGTAPGHPMLPMPSEKPGLAPKPCIAPDAQPGPAARACAWTIPDPGCVFLARVCWKMSSGTLVLIMRAAAASSARTVVYGPVAVTGCPHGPTTPGTLATWQPPQCAPPGPPPTDGGFQT